LWWLRHLTFRRSAVLLETPDGLPAVIDREDYGQILLYCFRSCPELLVLLSDTASPCGIWLDLGANIVLLSVHMSNCTGEHGKVIVVEPIPAVAAQLMCMSAHFFPKRLIGVQVWTAQDVVGVLNSPAEGFSESIEVRKDSDSAPRAPYGGYFGGTLSPRASPGFH